MILLRLLRELLLVKRKLIQMPRLLVFWVRFLLLGHSWLIGDICVLRRILLHHIVTGGLYHTTFVARVPHKLPKLCQAPHIQMISRFNGFRSANNLKLRLVLLSRIRSFLISNCYGIMYFVIFLVPHWREHCKLSTIL